MFNTKNTLNNFIRILTINNIHTIAVFRYNFLYTTNLPITPKNKIILNTFDLYCFTQYREIAANFLKHSTWDINNTTKCRRGNRNIAFIQI